MVDVHHAALANGPYQAGYFAAFVLDPDGSNIAAVYYGPASRTAASVRINF